MEFNQFVKLTKETASQLSQFINCADDLDMKLLADNMANDHRTLVQKKMRLCLLFIERLAKDLDNDQFDLRNEHACRLAKQICTVTDKYDRMMPLI